MTEPKMHYEGCWRSRAHHDCAVARVLYLQTVLAQARKELKQRQESQAYTDRILRETNDKLATAVAQARAELKDLQGANRECGRRLEAMRESREYWYEKALAAEAERDKVRKEAQEQSDLMQLVQRVQRDWLSPEEAEGLKTQLVDARRVARLWFRRAHGPWVEVEITGQEMVEALQAERQLRQEAEKERDEASRNLSQMVELNEWSRNELDRVNERAERAEALAALVTPELAALLEKVGGLTGGSKGWTSIGFFTSQDGERCLELAAKIRETLDDE